METIIAYILKDTLHIRTQRNYHMTSSCEEKKRDRQHSLPLRDGKHDFEDSASWEKNKAQRESG